MITELLEVLSEKSEELVDMITSIYLLVAMVFALLLMGITITGFILVITGACR